MYVYIYIYIYVYISAGSPEDLPLLGVGALLVSRPHPHHPRGLQRTRMHVSCSCCGLLCCLSTLDTRN